MHGSIVIQSKLERHLMIAVMMMANNQLENERATICSDGDGDGGGRSREEPRRWRTRHRRTTGKRR